jgi:hypothetical protein
MVKVPDAGDQTPTNSFKSLAFDPQESPANDSVTKRALIEFLIFVLHVIFSTAPPPQGASGKSLAKRLAQCNRIFVMRQASGKRHFRGADEPLAKEVQQKFRREAREGD